MRATDLPFATGTATSPEEGPAGLRAHEAAVRRDLRLLTLPPANWPASAIGPDGKPALDVLVVGAGMLGIAAGAALTFKGVRNISVLDRAPPGREGPWLTFARMETLRSPKHLTGPALGIPSLTFRAWYEARFGEAGWEALYKIPNVVWVDYLTWLRTVLELPVRNDVSVERVRSAGGFIEVVMREGGRESRLFARHVVFATGRGGAGGANIPRAVDPGLRPDLAAHSAEDIDFAALAGRSLAIMGAGASAWDNAATALEAGAGRVDMYARRSFLPQVNKGRGSAYPGFYMGWQALDDAELWSLMVYLEDAQAPPPHETVHRTIRHPDFHLHFASPITTASRDDGRVRLSIGGVPEPRYAEFLIVGTGFRVDLATVPELADLATLAATWGDRYAPPAELVRPDLARYPYLGPGFELLEKTPGTGPDLSRIHLFNYGAHASHRQLSGDVPGVDYGAEKLSLAISKALFREDVGQLRRALEEFAEPELESTPFFASPRPSSS